MTSPRKDDWRVSFGLYGAVGIQFVAAIAVGMWGGDFLDRRWQTGPWLGLVGIVLGASIGFFNLYRILRSRDREDKDPES